MYMYILSLAPVLLTLDDPEVLKISEATILKAVQDRHMVTTVSGTMNLDDLEGSN